MNKMMVKLISSVFNFYVNRIKRIYDYPIIGGVPKIELSR